VKFRSEKGNADTQHAAQGQAQRERGTSDTPRPKANAANTRTRSARTHHKQGPTPDRAVATAKRKNYNASAEAGQAHSKPRARDRRSTAAQRLTGAAAKMTAVLRTRERSMLPRIKPGNGSARLMGGGAHGDTCTHQTQARALQCGLAAPTPAVHGGEDRESGLRGGGPRLAPGRRRSSLRDITMQSVDGRRAIGEGTDNKADGGRVPESGADGHRGPGRRHGGVHPGGEHGTHTRSPRWQHAGR